MSDTEGDFHNQKQFQSRHAQPPIDQPRDTHQRVVEHAGVSSRTGVFNPGHNNIKSHSEHCATADLVQTSSAFCFQSMLGARLSSSFWRASIIHSLQPPLNGILSTFHLSLVTQQPPLPPLNLSIDCLYLHFLKMPFDRRNVKIMFLCSYQYITFENLVFKFIIAWTLCPSFNLV